MFVLKFSGSFGFIKPYSAVRDELTYSQQFLTPSIIEGIRQKLFPNNETCQITRHRLRYKGLSVQQECTQSKNFVKIPKTKNLYAKATAILNRGILIEPELFLAFNTRDAATNAMAQHICLCRNEDVLLPDGQFIEITDEEFDDPTRFSGFELLFGYNDLYVGHNRYTNEPMYGKLSIIGDPC